MRSGRRVVGTVVLIDAMAITLFFAAALAGYSANVVIPSLALRWELTGSLLEFFRWMPMLQFLAIAVALGTVEGRSGELLTSAIPPAAILSALLAAAAMVSISPLQSSRTAAERSSEVFDTAVADTRQALDGGDTAGAEAAAARARAISPGDPRLTQLDSVLSAALARASAAAPDKTSKNPPRLRDVSGAKAYYFKALSLAEKGQDFEANWYAREAARIDPTYLDAKRLAAKTWDRLQAKSEAHPGEARAAFYGRKLEGYGLLVSGDSIGAYRIFSELSISHSGDPDVRRYLAESLAAVKKSAFFTAEVDEAFAGTVLGPVLLRIPTGDGGLRILAARDAAWGDNALFFREPELLRAAAPGQGATETVHVYADYGKLSQGKLFLTCVDERHPSIVHRPRWLAGPTDGIASAVDLPLSPEVAYRLVTAQTNSESLSLIWAWRTAEESADYGLDPRPILMMILERCAIPFTVFTASTLGIFAGLRFRRRQKGRARGNASTRAETRVYSRWHYALVPFMAAALIPVLILSERLDLLISTWSLRIVPNLGALALASGLRAAGLFLAVLLLAGAGVEREDSKASRS